MQPVNLIVSCTNRKKAVVPEKLQLRSLINESLSCRLEQWVDRLQTYDVPPRRAADLYAGDHWQVAQAIPREAAESDWDIRLWICSAGYGLVRQSDLLKPYSATFVPRHPDSVSASAPGATKDATAGAWWPGLGAYPASKGAPRSIAELAAREPRIPVLLVASEPYLLAMASDLHEATGGLASRNLLSILSIGANPKRLARLKAHLLPADARFEAVVGGTRTALNARVARYLFRQLPNGALPSKRRLGLTLARLATDLPPLQRFNRQRISDPQVRRFIDQERRADPQVTKTLLLKRLRASGMACEQFRFSEIFKQTVDDSVNGA
jgi:hypothetical protein